MHLRRLTALTGVLVLTACSGSQSTPSRTTAIPTAANPTGSTTARASSSAPGTSTPAPSSSSTDPTRACIDTLAASLSPAQKAGQLVMVGLDRSSTAASLDAMIARNHIGNVFFIGGWRQSGRVKDASSHVQAQANPNSTKSVRFLIAADQEGGQVQQLKGNGFTPLPSALAQGALSQADRSRLATTIAAELTAAGVNVDLAPVADTVPPSAPRSNEPIGRWGRQYANDPAKAGAAVTDVVKALRAGGVQPTLKHFPGLGRITGNTDFTAAGIVDDTTTADDEYLRPFADGIAAGAPLVMMSSAYYSRMDAANQAVYSPRIITEVLRGRLGFGGVVVSDDLNAVAVRGIPAGQRIVRFIEAGGDIALTGLASAAPVMANAVVAEAAKDPAFAKKVDASVKRVLDLKTAAGLTPCSRTS